MRILLWLHMCNFTPNLLHEYKLIFRLSLVNKHHLVLHDHTVNLIVYYCLQQRNLLKKQTLQQTHIRRVRPII